MHGHVPVSESSWNGTWSAWPKTTLCSFAHMQVLKWIWKRTWVSKALCLWKGFQTYNGKSALHKHGIPTMPRFRKGLKTSQWHPMQSTYILTLPCVGAQQSIN